MMDRIGQQLGNYRLTRLVGRGGFAEVYVAEHILIGTIVAIKVLHTQVTQEDVTQFQQEARLLASLKHPHIVRVFDFGIAGQTPYLVMDYASMGTLRTRHPRGTQLPVSTVIGYVKQIAEGLQYAHERKIVHRDIKPENMLIGENGEILLSDFGIALVAQSSRYQPTQDVIGTAAYMSPEQIQGKPRAASDQYSLGIVIYEWLTGMRPFQGSFTELCSQHMFASLPPLSERVPVISSEVEQVVTIALAKDYKQRFESVLAFAAALEQATQVMLPPARSHSLGISSQLYSSPLPSHPNTPPPLTATISASQLQQPVEESRKQQSDKNKTSLGNIQQSQQVQQQVEQSSNSSSEKKTSTSSPVGVAISIDTLFLSIILGLFLHSWWVFGGVFLIGMLISVTVENSVKKKFDYSAIATIPLLLFPWVWGYIGWLSNSFMSSIIHFQFLPQALAVIAFMLGLVRHAIALGNDLEN
jgi:serine/threonine protein kinase